MSSEVIVQNLVTVLKIPTWAAIHWATITTGDPMQGGANDLSQYNMSAFMSEFYRCMVNQFVKTH
jgi:hypothetical protein